MTDDPRLAAARSRLPQSGEQTEGVVEALLRTWRNR